MMNSMIIETETRTKQTTATAHVGVCSKDLPALPPAMFGASLPLPSYVSKLARIYTVETNEAATSLRKSTTYFTNVFKK